MVKYGCQVKRNGPAGEPASKHPKGLDHEEMPLMAQSKSSAGYANAHPPAREGRHCEVCGVSSYEKTLVGIRNDRRKDGPRFCVPHHPESMTASVGPASLVGAAAELSGHV
jgi:hypothetical protein